MNIKIISAENTHGKVVHWRARFSNDSNIGIELSGYNNIYDHVRISQIHDSNPEVKDFTELCVWLANREMWFIEYIRHYLHLL